MHFKKAAERHKTKAWDCHERAIANGGALGIGQAAALIPPSIEVALKVTLSLDGRRVRQRIARMAAPKR
jgi:hypothetical protein